MPIAPSLPTLKRGETIQQLLTRIAGAGGSPPKLTGVALPAGSYSGTGYKIGPVIDMTGYSGLILYFNVTVAGGGGSTVLVHVQFLDPATGLWVDAIRPSTSASGVFTYLYVYHPRVDIVGTNVNGSLIHASAGLPMPDQIRLVTLHSLANQWNYSLGYCLLP